MENAIQSFHSIVQGSAWHSATGLVQYSLPGHQVTTISSFEKLFLKFYFQYNKQNVVMLKKKTNLSLVCQMVRFPDFLNYISTC